MRVLVGTAAVHPHVGTQDEVAGKRDQEVLAAGGHRLDGPADHGMVVGNAGDGRVDRLEAGDGPAGEHAVQRLRGPVNRIAFRHWRRLVRARTKVGTFKIALSSHRTSPAVPAGR
jgi:hypothetical protein